MNIPHRTHTDTTVSAHCTATRPALTEKLDDLLLENRQLRAALAEIATSNPVENSFDPERNTRYARAALNKISPPTHRNTSTGETVRMLFECLMIRIAGHATTHAAVWQNTATGEIITHAGIGTDAAYQPLAKELTPP